jgi:hypothetical protein
MLFPIGHLAAVDSWGKASSGQLPGSRETVHVRTTTDLSENAVGSYSTREILPGSIYARMTLSNQGSRAAPQLGLPDEQNHG